LRKTQFLRYFESVNFMQFFSSICFLFLLLTSCGSQNWEKKALRVDATAHLILEELKGVNDKEALVEKQERLKNLFSEWILFLCEADAVRRERGYDGVFSLSLKECRNLQNELNRIQLIEGCKEIIENCQRDALHFLDAYDRKHQRQDPFLMFQKKGTRILR
jgi:hypothetical protein